MNLKPYQEFVLLKAAPPRQLTEQEFNLNHACLGLATEALELQLAEDQENYREELEDIAWYMMLLATSLEIDLDLLPDQYDDVNPEDPMDEFVLDLEKMISLGKKTCMYGKSKISDMRILFFPLWKHFLELLYDEEYPLDVVIQNNMEKLNKRYATTFSQEESETRKDKQ